MTELQVHATPPIDPRTGKPLLLGGNPDLTKPRLSWTQISLYQRCPRAYWYRYIQGQKTPSTPELVLGSAWHAGIEANLSQKIVTCRDLPIAEVTDAFVGAWRSKCVAENLLLEQRGKDEAEELGIAMTRAYHADIAPTLHPVAVEQPFLIGLGEAFPFTLYGIFDAVTSDARIIDHKGYSKFSFSKAQKEIHEDGQLTVYSLAYRAVKQREESALALGIAVKEVPVRTAVLETTRTSAQIEWFLGLIEQVGRGIVAGVFPPRTDTWAHAPKWCGYWNQCMSHAAAR